MIAWIAVYDSPVSVDDARPSVDRTGSSVDTLEINMLRCE